MKSWANAIGTALLIYGVSYIAGYQFERGRKHAKETRSIGGGYDSVIKTWTSVFMGIEWDAYKKHVKED